MNSLGRVQCTWAQWCLGLSGGQFRFCWLLCGQHYPQRPAEQFWEPHLGIGHSGQPQGTHHTSAGGFSKPQLTSFEVKHSPKKAGKRQFQVGFIFQEEKGTEGLGGFVVDVVWVWGEVLGVFGRLVGVWGGLVRFSVSSFYLIVFFKGFEV